MNILLYFRICWCSKYLFHFSACQGEWTDCVSEDEEYLQKQTSFYDECTLVSSSSDASLENASINTCSGPRRCENGRSSDADDQPFIGYDPFGNCTCHSQSESFSNKNTNKEETPVRSLANN